MPITAARPVRERLMRTGTPEVRVVETSASAWLRVAAAAGRSAFGRSRRKIVGVSRAAWEDGVAEVKIQYWRVI
jgi:hypothetical protein